MKVKFLDKRFMVAFIALVGAALACSAPSTQSESTPSAAVAEAFTNTPFVVTATPEAIVVTATPDPSTGSGGTTGGSGGTDCPFNSVYIADLTIPDGAEVQTGAAFTKTWRVQNNGCQVWPEGTSLIFLSGDQMSGPASVPVPATATNGTQDISVNLTAPGAVGSAQGKWQLRAPDGTQFGDKLTVKINTVAPPPPAPGATSTYHLVMPPGGFKLAPTATPKFLVPLLPLLTADFTATYGGAKASCAGPGTDYWVKVKNTGGLTLESSYSKLEAPPGTQKDDSSSNAPFRGSKSCDGGQSSLDADNSAWLLAATTGPAIASGTNAKITIKLCGLDDQGGFCATKTVSFAID